MRAELRDLKRALAKKLAPKPDPKPSKIGGFGFTQKHGQPFPRGRRGRRGR